MYPFFWSINIFINNLCCVNWNILKFAAKNPDAQDPAPHFHVEEVHLWWADLIVSIFSSFLLHFTPFFISRQAYPGQTGEVFPEK